MVITMPRWDVDTEMDTEMVKLMIAEEDEVLVQVWVDILEEGEVNEKESY